MSLSQRQKNTLFVIGIILAFVLMGVMSALIINRLFSSTDTAQIVDTTKGDTANDVPRLAVSEVISGLDHPWEIVFSRDNAMYITERSGAISKVTNGTKAELIIPPDVIARGEGGMMGLALHPQFEKTPYLYACFNSTRGPDVRVVRWQVNGNALSERTELVTGLPAANSGRHSGRRIGFAADGNLWIGTGDAADEDTPQSLSSLGGKILRVDPLTGKGVTGNITTGDNRIYSYGHRNTQGLAFYEREVDGSYGISVEHGPDVDDEANELKSGNFGWAPGAGYDESVPMTDTSRFPNAVPAIWSSGDPTIAAADADFVLGEKWGAWNNRLAVAALKGRHLRLLQIENGQTREQLKLYDGEYGRLRAVTLGYDNSLYVSTDNGNEDKILKITPSL